MVILHLHLVGRDCPWRPALREALLHLPRLMSATNPPRQVPRLVESATNPPRLVPSVVVPQATRFVAFSNVRSHIPTIEWYRAKFVACFSMQPVGRSMARHATRWTPRAAAARTDLTMHHGLQTRILQRMSSRSELASRAAPSEMAVGSHLQGADLLRNAGFHCWAWAQSSSRWSSRSCRFSRPPWRLQGRIILSPTRYSIPSEASSPRRMLGASLRASHST